MRFIDHVRAVLHDATNEWHIESGNELTRRFELLSDGDQEAAQVALDRVRQSFREIHQLFGKVK